ncbi:hypothetical protein BaRGS_00013034 [Batillaria attramentaria]|uniref:Nose resistant-to-fluoxetine protein N-terminal domain-containing protein n=1 Tax=Batillaria attramentaria TaxID=370345 RepID=A0ABD0L8S1_9CAEN
MPLLLSLLLVIFSGLLSPTSAQLAQLAQLAPPYMDRFSILAQTFRDAQTSSGSVDTRDSHPVKILSSLSPSILQKTLLDSAKSFVASTEDVVESGNMEAEAVSPNITMSTLCVNHTVDTVMGLLSGQPWALKMLDAMGKPTPAIAELNTVWPGAFEYCRTVQSSNTTPPFSGQYCNAAMQIPGWPKRSAEGKPYMSANGQSCVDGEAQPLLGKPDTMVQTYEPGTCCKIFLAFSVYTNGAKLLSTKQAPGSLSCVHGIRFLTNLGPYFTEANKRWTFQAISNATVSVDTFFVLSGLLVAYLSLKEMKKRSGKMNWFLFYFHRFWRLTPAYMLLMMFYVCVFLYMGKGPFWPETVADIGFCEKNWWTNLLYVNNFVNTNEMCFGHSWYLANDMQFYILSPLIFVPFFFSPIIGVISSAVFLLVTSIVPGVLAMQQHFPPSFLAPVEGNNTFDMQDYMGDYYIKPYNRMGPYVVGMLAGYFLYRTDCKLRISWITNMSIWAMATASALAVLYGLYDATNGHPVTLPVSAFYNAVNRQVWGACVAWVVIACVTGNGGFVNTILSWSALIPLSRLTYCIYLLHIMVIFFFVYSMDMVFYYSDINVVCFFLAVLVISCMAATIASLAFEAPMMGLEKLLFHRNSPVKEEKRSVNNAHHTDQ